MTQIATTIAQIGIQRLPALHSSLTETLSEGGFNSVQLSEIFSAYVSAECVLCGTRVTGEEMGGITSAAEKPLAPDSKFGRLRHGSCARSGCISAYYRVHLREYPNLDWTKIREKATEDDAFKEANTARRRLLIRLALGVAVILILLLWRCIMYYGHVPLLQKPHKYNIDPASAGPDPPR